MKPLSGFLLVLWCFFAPRALWANSVPGQHPGYLSEVSRERTQKIDEMVLVPPREPEVIAKPLVDDRLTKEFQSQYRLKFGQTETEVNYNSANRYTFYDYPGGRQETILSHNDRQRDFGEFMMRRLAEHHVDQYAKSNPDIRPVYELKDRISNLDVQVRQGYKVRFKYSYSGNFLEVKLENPYEIGSKVTLQMQDSVGPSRVEKTIFNLAYPVSKVTTVQLFHELDDGVGSKVVGSRKLTESLSTNITATHNTVVDPDAVQPSQRHDLVLWGFAWTE